MWKYFTYTEFFTCFTKQFILDIPLFQYTESCLIFFKYPPVQWHTSQVPLMLSLFACWPHGYCWRFLFPSWGLYPRWVLRSWLSVHSSLHVTFLGAGMFSMAHDNPPQLYRWGWRLNRIGSSNVAIHQLGPSCFSVSGPVVFFVCLFCFFIQQKCISSMLNNLW